MSPATYRAGAFLSAGERLGLEIVQGIDLPESLADYWHVPLGLDFTRPEQRPNNSSSTPPRHPVDAILSVDDSASLSPPTASAALGLPHNSPDAALAARDKHVMREALPPAASRSRSSPLRLTTTRRDRRRDRLPLRRQAAPPLRQSRRDPGRRPGRIRRRLRRARGRILCSTGRHRPRTTCWSRTSPRRRGRAGRAPDRRRVASARPFRQARPARRSLLRGDDLRHPFPPPAATQAASPRRTAEAAAALGLREGPVHAELRINERGPWLIEMAGRSIGGLCSSVLEFGAGVSLEELILRHAVGLPLRPPSAPAKPPA